MICVLDASRKQCRSSKSATHWGRTLSVITLERLRDGYSRYRTHWFPDYEPLFKQLAEEGQHPKALVVSCCDSRVNPALVFDQDPGDLFVVRNVANVIPPYAPDPGCHGTSAAVEFAVTVLEVADIIVLGHAKCGGIQALIDMASGKRLPGEFLKPWISIAEPALQLAESKGESDQEHTVRAELGVVRLSLDNLATFPWVAERMKRGRLELHGFYFDVHDGSVKWLNPETDSFENFA